MFYNRYRERQPDQMFGVFLSVEKFWTRARLRRSHFQNVLFKTRLGFRKAVRGPLRYGVVISGKVVQFAIQRLSPTLTDKEFAQTVFCER
jgi:hypothetical protein